MPYGCNFRSNRQTLCQATWPRLLSGNAVAMSRTNNPLIISPHPNYYATEPDFETNNSHWGQVQDCVQSDIIV